MTKYLFILHVYHNLSVNILVNSLFVSTRTLASINKDITLVKNVYRDINPVKSIYKDITLVNDCSQSIHKDIIPVKIVRTCLIFPKLFLKYFSKVKSFFSFQKIIFSKKYFLL